MVLVRYFETIARKRVAVDPDALAVIVHVATNSPVPGGSMILTETIFDDAAHRLRFRNADRHGRLAAVKPVAWRTHRFEMNEIKRQRPAAYGDVDFEAIAPENAFIGGIPGCLELGCVQAEVVIGQIGMAGHAHEFYRLAVRRFVAHHHRDVDA